MRFLGFFFINVSSFLDNSQSSKLFEYDDNGFQCSENTVTCHYYAPLKEALCFVFKQERKLELQPERR